MSDRDDQQHLLLLTIFHYIAAGLMALAACVPFIHVFMGLAMVFGAFDDTPDGPPPAFLGWLFMGIGAAIIVVGWAMAVLILVTAWAIHHRRWWLFCVIAAGIECVFFPLGTILGVLSIVVLVRPSVKAQFEGQPPAEAP